MKWVADTVHPRMLHLEIVAETLTSLMPGLPDQMAYSLCVWENGKGTHDFLQDTLEIAMEQARDDFGVPLDAWRQVE